ncbi:uncharacterized protein LOC143211590 isoform X1 [Lasioglossum baleicum]|uniref:uncharacterized protein LOC143211590 isoform X1 n=1 Tax=Lasioglossum baleicum TaxID=434251 RepID=UPI003FCE222C
MTLTQLLTPPCPTSRFKPEGHGESSRRLGQTDKRTASRAAGGTTQHGKSLDTTLVSQATTRSSVESGTRCFSRWKPRKKGNKGKVQKGGSTDQAFEGGFFRGRRRRSPGKARRMLLEP